MAKRERERQFEDIDGFQNKEGEERKLEIF
jgi:hypothetical protein